jgi:hypothetical protein
MNPTQSSMDHMIPDMQPAVQEKRRFRDVWMLSVPTLIIVGALYHLATCWNCPQPTLGAIRSQRTIHFVRTGHQVLTSTQESPSEPSLVADDDLEFAALPASGPSGPYGAGWR